jgi:hypothetical protein
MSAPFLCIGFPFIIAKAVPPRPAKIVIVNQGVEFAGNRACGGEGTFFLIQAGKIHLRPLPRRAHAVSSTYILSLRRFDFMALASSFRKILCAALAVASIAAFSASARAALLDSEIAKNLAPHKALYDIRMVTRHSGASILNIHGQMGYQWRPDCDAWLTSHHFNLAYEYADAPVLNVVSDFSTYEPFDGKSLTFTSRRAREGDLYEELRGSAFLGPNGIGKATYSMPPELGFDLSKGTLFPMKHTIALLKSIKSGKKFFNAVVFDGSDDEGPVEISAVAGKMVNGMTGLTPSPKLDASLLSGPAWFVRMAFFPEKTPGEEADYEMNAVIHENGIISDMRIDYKDFSVTQKLVALERLKNAACGLK